MFTLGSFLFPHWRNHRPWGEGKEKGASQCIAVLAWGGVKQSEYNCSSYPSNAIPFWSLCSGVGVVLQPYPHVLRFSNGVLPMDSC